MQARKERVHHHGKANRDFKMIDALEHTAKKSEDRLTLLSTAKSKKFDETLKDRQNRLQQYKDPVLATQQSIPKEHQKPPHQIAYPRFAHLEEKEIRKRVFCGDSNTLFHDEEEHQVLQQPTNEKHNKEKLALQKHEERATGIQETQLVGLENKNTLEGKVDIEKVREIRRAIRRRYANRKNFQKIFNLWDEDSNGAITIRNLYNMILRMGININFDEARVLLASSDKDGSNDLALDEFLDMIFNDKDALNVNLKALPALSENEKNDILSNQETIQFLQKDAKQTRIKMHNNQVNMILKNKVQQLAQQFLTQDLGAKGVVPHHKFQQIIKKLEIDEKIISEEDINHLYNQFKNSDDHLDYKQFITHLKQFHIVEDEQKAVVEQKHQQKENNDRKHQLLKAMKSHEEKKINIYDITRIDSWQLEQIRKRAQKMFNKLSRYIPEDQFNQLLKEKSDEQGLSVQQFTEVVSHFLQSVNESYKKTELESLLSVVQFGNYDCVNIQEVSKIIYNESDQEFYDRVQLRRKGPPPPPQHSKVPHQSAIQAQIVEERNFFSNGLSAIPKGQDKDLHKVLTCLENVVFNKSEKAYKIFKQFDVDGDGFISQQDLKAKINQLAILTSDETDLLIKYVDPEDKGFLNFNDFHKKIRSGMTILDDKGNQIVQISTQSNSIFPEASKQYLPELNSQIEAFKKPYKEHSRPATRFGATPAYKNTFQAFVPPRTSPMFMPPQQQYDKCRENFQYEERSHKSQLYEGKLRRIQNYHRSIQDRIQSAVELNDTKEHNNLKSKQMTQWTYEHNAHLKNDYL